MTSSDSIDAMAQAKRALRMQVRTLRRSFVMAGGLPEIELPAFLRQRIGPQTVIASYLPQRFEADPGPMTKQAAARGATIALPHTTTRDAPMRFLQWHEGDPLEVGPLGIRQPTEAAPECAPDIILTPLIGFDAKLNRMGQGAGFYDRTFAALPDALRIGVAWSVQQVDTVPTDPWDVPLHAIVTERGVILPA